MFAFFATTAIFTNTCTSIENTFKTSGCCGDNGNLTRQALVTLIEETMRELQTTQPCIPSKGNHIVTLPFAVDATIGPYNVGDVAYYSMADQENAPIFQEGVLTPYGPQKNISGVEGVSKILWIRPEHAIADYGVVSPTILDTLAFTFRPTIQTLFIVDDVCNLRFEGTGWMTNPEPAQGWIVGSMKNGTLCTESHKNWIAGPVVMYFSFATWPATMEFYKWTNPNDCLPLPMGQGSLMVNV